MSQKRNAAKHALLILEELESRTTPATLTVNSAKDTGPLTTDDLKDGVLTLREAIALVNRQRVSVFDTGMKMPVTMLLSKSSFSEAAQKQINTATPLGTNDQIIFDIGDAPQTIAVQTEALPA